MLEVGNDGGDGRGAIGAVPASKLRNVANSLKRKRVFNVWANYRTEIRRYPTTSHDDDKRYEKEAEEEDEDSRELMQKLVLRRLLDSSTDADNWNITTY